MLGARAEDGLTVDGKPLTGEVRLRPDSGPVDDARVALGERRFVVLRREGLWAVRDFDPAAPNRHAFRSIEATPYDARWSLSGTFRRYEERTVRVKNADGVERGLQLAGEAAFVVDGTEHTLQAAVEPDGSLWIVFADATSGDSSFRFRFLRPAAPAADGSVTVDFNRALLPPCAFADHFICPFPPPGNTLPIAVPAGSGSGSTAEPAPGPRCGISAVRPGPGSIHAAGAGAFPRPVRPRAAERRPCATRGRSQILPISACQEHGIRIANACRKPDA